jgi:hypothetical protein
MSATNFLIGLSGTLQSRFIQHREVRVETRVYPVNPIKNASRNLDRRELVRAQMRREILQRQVAERVRFHRLAPISLSSEVVAHSHPAGHVKDTFLEMARFNYSHGY